MFCCLCEEGNEMLARSITVFACTLLALGIASAGAEPCSQEIMELTRKLAASDTGLDPTTAGTPAMADAQNEQQQLGTLAMNNTKAGTSPHDGPHQAGTRFDANRALEHA